MHTNYTDALVYFSIKSSILAESLMLQDLVHLQKFLVLIDILIFILGSGEKMALRKYGAKMVKGSSGSFQTSLEMLSQSPNQNSFSNFFICETQARNSNSIFFKKKSNFLIDWCDIFLLRKHM